MSKQNISTEEANQVIDRYFASLENNIETMIRHAFALMLKTADDKNLCFPDDIQEASQIEVGTGPVKMENGALATGEFTMPNGRILRIDKAGYVIEIAEPTPEEIAAKIREDMAAIKAEVRAITGRKPYRHLKNSK